MAKDNNLPDITITGGITVNGPMFDIHDNQHVHITQSGKESSSGDEDCEYVDFVFFEESFRLHLIYHKTQDILRHRAVAQVPVLQGSVRDPEGFRKFPPA